MNSRRLLHQTLSLVDGVRPPRYESEFSEEVIDAWRRQDKLGNQTPEQVFQLDHREDIGVAWRRQDTEKSPIESEADVAGLRRAYDPSDPERYPQGWSERATEWAQRDHALSAAPWNEGFFQVIGISGGSSLARALVSLCERPELIEAAMDWYGTFLETLIGRAFQDVELDYAVCYEPIASNHGLVVSPATYERFALPALRRTTACLDRHGVAHRIMWTAGAVRELVPLWLDAGINGLYLNQSGLARLPYTQLRREFGRDLRLFGGVDWRVVLTGPHAVDEFLHQEVEPVLEQGGYVPYLDDTVRGYMPFDAFRYYRDRLDTLVDKVFA